MDVDHAHFAPQAVTTKVFALGDASFAPNAKTVAAARKQAPMVALNVLAEHEGYQRPCRPTTAMEHAR